MRTLAPIVLLAACGSKESPQAPAAKDAAVVVEVARDAAPATPDATRGAEHPSFKGFVAVAEGAALAEGDEALLVGVPPIAPDCDEDASRALALSGDVDATRPGAERVIVSLTHGVVAPPLRAAEALTGCGGSQTELAGAWVGQAVPDPELEIVVIETTGGKNMGAETLHVLKRKDDRFVAILTHTLSEYEGDEETSSPIQLTDLTWDPAEFRLRK